MEFVEKHFPYGFRRKANGRTTPSARFEALAVGSFLAHEQKPAIANADLKVASWIETEEFLLVAGSGSANVIKKLRGRLQFVRDKLLSA